MSKAVKITKGLDIRLEGEAEQVLGNFPLPEVFAIKPPDFHGLTPKLLVKQGDQLRAGTPLFRDKYNEEILFTSPVSGELIEVNRGEKRKVLELKILADKEIQYEDFGPTNPSSLSREEIIKKLLGTGLWPFVKQRPFDVIANPTDKPKSIFVSAFDSSPLAPDSEYVVRNNEADFQAGLDALSKLTDGKVHLNTKAGTGSGAFSSFKGVQINSINGAHPAGNVGVQIHHIDPLNKGEVVWYVNLQDVLILGRLFNKGKFDATRLVALTGSEVKSPKYFKMPIGSSLKKLIEENKSSDNVRIISGNVLTGSKIPADGFLGFYHTQVTLVPEGDNYKFLLTDGWLSAGFNKFSLSKTYPTWLASAKKKFKLDTNLNGEERAFVVTGQYEKVFPFDIYPVQLLKAILVNDIELMENLGIYEVAPEDFALCEYVCTSKINSQKIVRGGLDVMLKEFA